jgi:hypothetical protein
MKQIQGISMKNENYIQSLVEDGNLNDTKLFLRPMIKYLIYSTT